MSENNKKRKVIRYTKSPIKPKERRDRIVMPEAWLKGRRNPRRSWHIKLGDKVIMISGSQKGTVSKVIAVYPDEAAVKVEGVNIKSRHKKQPGQEKGQIIKQEHKTPMCKVALCVKVEGKDVPTRVRYNEDGKRISVKTNEIIE